MLNYNLTERQDKINVFIKEHFKISVFHFCSSKSILYEVLKSMDANKFEIAKAILEIGGKPKVIKINGKTVRGWEIKYI